MKGQIVMSFQVPSRGLVANVPPHLVGPEALTNGSNVFVDLDGLLKVRRGILPVGSQLNPIERVMGLASYEDNSGNFYPTAGTPTRWQTLQAGAWVDVSGGTLLHGTINDPNRFTSFASSGINYIIGCNNVDPLYEWHSGAPTYNVVPNSPISRSVLTLGNRVVCFNTVEAGIRYPFRVRWSAINDQTSWPVLAFADLIDSGCSIIGAALTSRLSCVIYRQFAGWYMQAAQGGDPNAFIFDRIPAGDHMTGPVSPASIIIAEGSHFYLGVDGRIYSFNGSSIFPISDPIDPIIRAAYNNTNSTRFSATYVPQYRQLVFFFTAGATTNSDPMSAIVFDLRRQVFEPLWTFPIVISAAEEMRTSVASFPTLNWTNWSSPTDTWLTLPWATWDSLPSNPSSTASQLLTFIGDSNGNIYRFGVANTDNGTPIPYNASWGLQRSADELGNSLVHYVEFYIQQSLTVETVVATVLGYFQPFSVTNQVATVLNLQMNTADQTTFYQSLTPGPANPANLKSNLLQLFLNSGGAHGQMVFGGATLLIDVDFRGDPRQGVGA